MKNEPLKAAIAAPAKLTPYAAVHTPPSLLSSPSNAIAISGKEAPIRAAVGRTSAPPKAKRNRKVKAGADPWGCSGARADTSG